MTLQSSLFLYSQVHQFHQRQDPNFPFITLPSGLDDPVWSPFNSKTFISRVSDHITSFKNTTWSKIRADSVDELGENLEEDMWERALLRVNDSTSCTKRSIIQFKSLHGIHSSNGRLARIFPNTDANCDRCRNTLADLTHMFWLWQPIGLAFFKFYQKHWILIFSPVQLWPYL